MTRVQRRYRWTWRRWLASVVILLLALLAAAELYARFGLGMGDPPLYVLDDEIGYMLRPSSRAVRYGIVIEHNSFGMRGPNFNMEKSSRDEFRLLLVGDSIIHGGAFTRQEELASSLLVGRLGKRLGRPVVVANASVGGWAPGHMLGYLRRFGTFNADAVIVMTNGRDYGSVAGPAPVQTEKPLFALHEIIVFYRAHVLHGLVPSLTPPDPWNPPVDPHLAARSLEDFRDLLELCRRATPDVLVLQHWRPEELDRGPEDGNPALAAVAYEMGIPVYSNDASFRAAREAGRKVYRDVAHPSAEGQAVMAEVMEEMLAEALGWE